MSSGSRLFTVFGDLIILRASPPNRAGSQSGEQEQHLIEGAVMVAFALHLLRTIPGLQHVTVRPDGEHGKQSDLKGWLLRRGFAMTTSVGKTSCGGLYAGPNRHSVLVNPKSGRMDVVAEHGNFSFGAECKGGIVNTKHPGQTSRLSRGLCEAVGRLMQARLHEGERQFAVVPLVPVTESLARKMRDRVQNSGIEIALITPGGEGAYVS